jgi:hypothetical protein
MLRLSHRRGREPRLTGLTDGRRLHAGQRDLEATTPPVGKTLRAYRLGLAGASR